MTIESDARFEEKLTCALENNMNLANFHQSTWESKLGLLRGTFIPSRKCMSLKFTGELCVMKIKKDAKFENFKTDMKNLTNFDSSTWKSQKSAL